MSAHFALHERGAPRYEAMRSAAVWNGRKPARYPAAIAVAQDEADVVAAIAEARQRNWRVAVRSGGHNFVGASVRDDGMLLNVAGLDEIRIDEGSCIATVGPGVMGERLCEELATRGLAFPTGHCPSVAVGGFALAGGLGFNPCAWGSAAMNVVAVDVVTADGELVRADRSKHEDLYWAARGAGPAFFGVVTRFHLRLHSFPQALASSTYAFPLTHLDALASWLDDRGDSLSPILEPMVWIGRLSGQTMGRLEGDAHRGDEPVVLLNAVAYAEDRAEATGALAALEACPGAATAPVRDRARPCTFKDMFDFQRILYPAGMRYAVDCLWMDAPPGQQPLSRLANQMRAAPSSSTHALWQLPFAAYSGESPDMAGGPLGRYFASFYATWANPADDEANLTWVRETMELADPLATGYYAGDVDLLASPARAARFLSPTNRDRVEQIRNTYDPNGRFQPPLAVPFPEQPDADRPADLNGLEVDPPPRS